jgi:hypothetical protein
VSLGSWVRANGAALPFTGSLHGRRLSLALCSLFSIVWLLEWAPLLPGFLGPQHFLAADHDLYFGAVRRFMSGGTFYPSAQLTGPYGVDVDPILYPPELIGLIAPLMLLPAVAWWLLPAAALLVAVWWHRPSIVVAPLIAACLAWPETTLKLLTGNPGMWMAAFLAIGTIKPAVSALVLLKPSLFPFALVGTRHHLWWVAAGLTAAPFAWLLPEYVAALRNFESPLGPLYSIREAPLLAIPVFIWLCGRHRPPAVDRLIDRIAVRSTRVELSAA